SAFGCWAAQQLVQGSWDVVHCFSGVAEEVFLALRETSTALTLVRGSAHIAEQHQILCDEEVRVGVWTEKPSPWILAREQREYELADAIIILGAFPERSFVERGVNSAKLYRIPLGVK